ncbi:hypothetical protein M3I53_35875 [Paraburkholderia sp. CNPSo 3272]|uniref:hypothetical protein n=1 Tax=Paraburkholderia sp. CNPSo 3272 TaxID=2940931 RepID=UPI0020B7D8FE|nr:hypothetical protein [Paraburkholderia sp. CNPSo 3272]MCP3728428.1 hypothetical protein [Paraburkholderia sp. CNPSo 3272]
MSSEFVERDLAHIRNVLSHLEHSADDVRAMEKGTVVSLSYWRARVQGILAMSLLPMHIEKQAKDLLGRLDRLESATPCAGAACNGSSSLPAPRVAGGHSQ